MFFGDCSLRLNRALRASGIRPGFFFFGDPRLVSEAPPLASRVGGLAPLENREGGGGEKGTSRSCVNRGPFFVEGSGRGALFGSAVYERTSAVLPSKRTPRRRAFGGGHACRKHRAGLRPSLGGAVGLGFWAEGCGTLRKPRPGRAFFPPGHLSSPVRLDRLATGTRPVRERGHRGTFRNSP